MNSGLPASLGSGILVTSVVDCMSPMQLTVESLADGLARPAMESRFVYSPKNTTSASAMRHTSPGIRDESVSVTEESRGRFLLGCRTWKHGRHFFSIAAEAVCESLL